MTIPIIPGPFSFLEHAGNAAKEIVGTKLALREQEIKRDLQSFDMLMTLINSGNAPANVLGKDENVALFGRLRKNLDVDVDPSQIIPSLQGQQTRAASEFAAASQPQPNRSVTGFKASNIQAAPETPQQVSKRRSEQFPAAQRALMGLPSELDIARQEIQGDQAQAIALGEAAKLRFESLSPIVSQGVKGGIVGAGVRILDDNYNVTARGREAVWKSVQSTASAFGFPLDPERDQLMVDSYLLDHANQQKQLDIEKIYTQARIGQIGRDNLVGLINAMRSQQTESRNQATQQDRIMEDNKNFHDFGVKKINDAIAAGMSMNSAINTLSGPVRGGWERYEAAASLKNNAESQISQYDAWLKELNAQALGQPTGTTSMTGSATTSSSRPSAPINPSGQRADVRDTTEFRSAPTEVIRYNSDGTQTVFNIDVIADLFVGRPDGPDRLKQSTDAGLFSADHMRAIAGKAATKAEDPAIAEAYKAIAEGRR